jgi:restriction endonuclease Mrr
VDVEAIHWTEKRRAIAECKATETKIGGGAVNKFVGALDAEKRKDSKTTGYFISLSGFTETAIEQEKEVGEERAILLNGM